MTAETILYIVIAGIIAAAVSLYVYAYRTSYGNTLKWVLGILRFGTLLALLLLIINPKLQQTTYQVEKPKLPILIDLSASIAETGDADKVVEWVNEFSSNEALQDKFDVSLYGFGTDFNTLDSLSFSSPQTRIEKALDATQAIYSKEIAPTVLISDGNQTFGADYEFSSLSFPNRIYPIMVGDSVPRMDLRIEQLNTNRYSFLKNEFPIEAILVYSGKEPVNTQFYIQQGNQRIFTQTLSFSETQNSQTISLSLPSQAVGLQRYQAVLEPLAEEVNTANNRKSFAVEVIDQATNVLVVSSLVHPDMGALKKSIETNEQRKVTFMEPSEAIPVLNDYQLVILFQPNRGFASLYAELEKLRKNTWVFTGLQTDWNFLNSVQDVFNKEASSASEEVSGLLNLNYSNYGLDETGFSDYTPLETLFGELQVSVPNEVLLHQKVDGFDTGSPMLFSVDLNGVKTAVWDAEGIWKWRAQSFLNTEGFQEFDEFIGKMVQYLASNKRKSRLEVSNETFYYNYQPIRIGAQYFDQNFVFDNRAQLEITVKNTETNEVTVFPMLLRSNFYEVDVSALSEGTYNFTVSVVGEGIARSGDFTILEFNVEQQFLNPNIAKLRRIASQTGGKAFFLDNAQNLVEDLLNEEAFKAIEKSQQKIVPLIDWKYLLALIVFLLSAEWFIRKYNGLI